MGESSVDGWKWAKMAYEILFHVVDNFLSCWGAQKVCRFFCCCSGCDQRDGVGAPKVDRVDKSEEYFTVSGKQKIFVYSFLGHTKWRAMACTLALNFNSLAWWTHVSWNAGVHSRKTPAKLLQPSEDEP